MPASETDNLLIRRIQEGEADAWRELIARFEGRLLAFVRSRIPDRATAEDVVQEAFIGLLASLPNYDRRRPLEGYLFSIAAHKLTDQLRRDGRLEETAVVAALAGEIEHCRRHAQWQKLQCMELLLVRGWSNKEAARQLQVSEQAVANWKFEFTARLRTCVRNQDLPAEVFPELYENV
jgi:RNA polymerase sigma-70 factor (ECF subfamily)